MCLKGQVNEPSIDRARRVNKHDGPYQATSSSPEGEIGQSALRLHESIAAKRWSQRAVVDDPGIGEEVGQGCRPLLHYQVIRLCHLIHCGRCRTIKTQRCAGLGGLEVGLTLTLVLILVCFCDGDKRVEGGGRRVVFEMCTTLKIVMQSFPIKCHFADHLKMCKSSGSKLLIDQSLGSLVLSAKYLA